MIRVNDAIWLGDSHDEADADLAGAGITAVLNVAHDLQGTRGWGDGLVYAQCGLVDGPGSDAAAYHSAVLQLLSLLAARHRVLVLDHDGKSRAPAVVIMALHARARGGWEAYRALLAGRMGAPDWAPHLAHRAAFDGMDWPTVMKLAGVT